MEAPATGRATLQGMQRITIHKRCDEDGELFHATPTGPDADVVTATGRTVTEAKLRLIEKYRAPIIVQRGQRRLDPNQGRLLISRASSA